LAVSATVAKVLDGVRLKNDIPEALRSQIITGLDYDSRRIGPGFLFFAFPGAKTDGRDFAHAAMERGAIAVLSEYPPPEGFAGLWLEVNHGREALAQAARNFYHAPDEAVALTGITGTNGKTTTGFLLDAILRAAGKTTALIGTIEYRLANQVLPALNTTPESLDIFRLLDELRQRGGTHATMEVSSHALALGRVAGLHFHTAVFTNLTRDHLDFHHTMEEYFAAKSLLFAPGNAPAPVWAIVNRDDEYGRKLPVAEGTRVIQYGLESNADLSARKVEIRADGLNFELGWEGHKAAVASALTGRINIYNILAAAGAAISHGLDLEQIAEGVAQLKAVPGRFERVEEGQPFTVAVDYAHTDDALRNVIATARGLSPKRVITLFGCGGDRDRAKRPLMAMAAAELSDFVVLTSDNPRSEDPIAVMNDALVGLRRFDTPHAIEPDREKAIRIALGEARPGDIVILAGKGHETYQVLRDRTIHFDDREVARAALREFGFSRKETAGGKR